MLSIGLVNFRNQNSTSGYQGDYAEKEEVGSTNSFELRLYDARIGRWMTTESYGCVTIKMKKSPTFL